MKIHIILIYCLFFMSACSTKTVEEASSTVLLPNLDILKEISDTVTIAENRKISTPFFIVLLNEYSSHDWVLDTTYTKVYILDTLFISEIEKINWLSQEYFFKKDSLASFNTPYYVLGTGASRMVFMFNSKEIYRAGLTAYFTCCPPKDIARIELFKDSYSGERTKKAFFDDMFKVTRLERAKIDKKLYLQAGVYLYKQGLLINE